MAAPGAAAAVSFAARRRRSGKHTGLSSLQDRRVDTEGRIHHAPRRAAVWKDLLKVRDIYLNGRTLSIGNGKSTFFWEDTWHGQIPLKDKFPDLFQICNETKITVAQLANKNWNLTYRRWLNENLQSQQRRLRDAIMTIAFSQEEDKAQWTWEKSRKFSVKSVYNHLCKDSQNMPFTKLWKAKIPLKIKVFLWLFFHNAILTRDNLIKRKWQGEDKCLFCQEKESASHLFFNCPATQYVWSVIAVTIGANCRPTSVEQFSIWCKVFLKGGEQYYIVGLAAVCWSLWRLRNQVCSKKRSKVF